MRASPVADRTASLTNRCFQDEDPAGFKQALEPWPRLFARSREQARGQFVGQGGPFDLWLKAEAAGVRPGPAPGLLALDGYEPGGAEDR